MMEELLNNLLKDCETFPDAIKIMVQAKIIDPQFIKDLQIYSVFSQFKRTELSVTQAVLSTAAKCDLPISTVWNVKKRIESRETELSFK